MTIFRQFFCNHEWTIEEFEKWDEGTYYYPARLQSKKYVFLCKKCSKMIVRDSGRKR